MGDEALADEIADCVAAGGLENTGTAEAVGNGGTTTAGEGELCAAYTVVDIDTIAGPDVAQTAEGDYIVDGRVVAYSAGHTEVVAGKDVADTVGTLKAWTAGVCRKVCAWECIVAYLDRWDMVGKVDNRVEEAFHATAVKGDEIGRNMEFVAVLKDAVEKGVDAEHELVWSSWAAALRTGSRPALL